MAKSLRKEESYSFPRGPMTLGEAAKEAESALFADYRADVMGVALAVQELSKKGELASAASVTEAVTKVVEKHPRVTYSQKAMAGLLVSKNQVAAFDEDAEIECDDGIPWGDLMFHAMRIDVIEALDALGVTADYPVAVDEDDDDSDEEDEDDDE